MLEIIVGPAVMGGGQLGTSPKPLEPGGSVVFTFRFISLHFNNTDEFLFNVCLFLATCKKKKKKMKIKLNLVFCPTMGWATGRYQLTINHLRLSGGFDFFFQLVQQRGLQVFSDDACSPYGFSMQHLPYLSY